MLENKFQIIEREELFHFYKASIENFRSEESLFLNPLDKHPNGLLTSRYGMDTANKIFAYFDTKKIFTTNFLSNFEDFEPKFEVSNYLPQSTYLVSKNNKHTFTHNLLSFERNTPTYYPFSTNDNLKSYENRKGQYFPCARVNHPHTRHIFTRDISDLAGREVKITSVSDKDLYLLPIGIDDEGKEINYNSFKFEALTQSNLVFTIPENFIGFILIDNSKKCEDFSDNQYLVMGSFTISYELL